MTSPPTPKPRRRNVVKSVLLRLDRGLNPREVAAELGMTERRVRYLARDWLGLSEHPTRRRIGAKVHVDTVKSLTALAEECQCTPQTMAAMLLNVSLADNGLIAKRLLGKLAKPAKARTIIKGGRAPGE